MADERMEGSADRPGQESQGGQEAQARKGKLVPPLGAAKEDQAHLRALQKARQARVAKVIVALVFVVILIVFVIQNSKAIEVNLVFGKVMVGGIWVMLSCAVIGALVGYLIGRPGRHSKLHKEEDHDDRRDKRKR